jgi:hypothetical protein
MIQKSSTCFSLASGNMKNISSPLLPFAPPRYLTSMETQVETQLNRQQKGGMSRSAAKAAAARQNGRMGGRPRKNRSFDVNPVYTSTLGHNAQAFANIAKLYFPVGSRVVDLTYGVGGFWKIAHSFGLLTTFCDIQERPGVQVICDARETPFEANTFHAAILDPPYRRDTSQNRVEPECAKRDIAPRYGLDIIDPKPWKDLMQVYEEMITEAKRIVHPGGVIVAKGMDDAAHWFVRDLPTVGCRIEDVHVVTTTSKPIMRHDFQLHARKNHSYFVILRKLKR